MSLEWFAYHLVTMAFFLSSLLQTFLVWQLTFSTVLLGRKYSLNQIAGCLLVAAGVVVAVARYQNLFLLAMAHASYQIILLI